MKKILLVILFLYSSTGLAFTYTLELSEPELQDKANALMPLEKKKFFITTILTNPTIDLVNGSEDINLTTDVQVKAPGNLSGSGVVSFIGSIRYQNESGSFYFDNLRVVSLEIEQLPKEALPKVQKVLEFVAKKFLAVKPVYTFKDNNLKHKLAKAALKSVRIENEKLLVLLGVF